MRYSFFLSLLLLWSCSSDEADNDLPCDPSSNTVWEGTPLTFSKADGANPTEEANQDRLTDNVWLTRDNNGGGLYNARIESAEDKPSSPEGTLWAVGEIADVCDLTFGVFRSTVGKPKDAVGQDLVVYLEDDDIYLPIKLTSWTQGSAVGGGFTYVRGTP